MELENLVKASDQSDCKVCRQSAAFNGCVDFNKNCGEDSGFFLPPVGIPIQYFRCGHCGLLFTNAFDLWDYGQFKKHIYNEDYVKVDPDYVHDRAANNAKVVADFIRRGRGVRLLDYGGGNGNFARILCQQGVLAQSWDPMEENQETPLAISFDMVTAFEVFEHTPNPIESTAEALGFLKPEGVFLFSTLTEEGSQPRPLNFWYVAPRNGHVTIYTKKSLKLLFAHFGYQVMHFSDLTHMAYKTIPSWLS